MSCCTVRAPTSHNDFAPLSLHISQPYATLGTNGTNKTKQNNTNQTNIKQPNSPFEEFFVAADAAVPAQRLWTQRYSLRKGMVPPFVTTQLANTVLNVGKSINFIRECCADVRLDEAFVQRTKRAVRDATDGNDNGGSGGGGGDDGVADVDALTRGINDAAAVINARVTSLMTGKYRLIDHFAAMKRYLLLGQGDFVQHLLGTWCD
jgi:hypothetical protein